MELHDCNNWPRPKTVIMKVPLSVWVLLLALYLFTNEATRDVGRHLESRQPKVKKSKFMHAVDEETYKTLYSLAQGRFNVPVQQRTPSTKNAVIRYWGRKAAFSVNV